MRRIVLVVLVVAVPLAAAAVAAPVVLWLASAVVGVVLEELSLSSLPPQPASKARAVIDTATSRFEVIVSVYGTGARRG